ncbi:MAG: ComEC/Rec2 family competence protein, partial [Elusimicrobia bacterium]|nr:ComEC/Rec2 family competence protein [Elusimicrobiota bacterium]
LWRGEGFYIKPPVAQDVFFAAPMERAQITGEVLRFPYKRKNQSVITLKIATLNGLPAQGRTLEYAPKNFEPCKGQKISVSGKLEKPFSLNIIGNFNWEKYLHKDGIYTQMRSTSALEISPPGFLNRLVNKIRNGMLRLFDSAFEPDLAAIISGIVLGEKTNMSGQLQSAFQDCGAVHLLVASGSNVGFVTLIVYFLAGFLKLQHRTSFIAALISAGFYTLCAGAEPPLLRAYLMTITAAVGYFLGRESGAFGGLTAAAFLMLILEPLNLWRADFQMSFLAVMGIVIFSGWKIPVKSALLRSLLSVALVSFSAQMFLYPVLIFYFHKISLLSIFSNIFLVPLSGVLMSAGFFIYAVSLTGINFLTQFFCIITGYLLEFFRGIVVVFASFDFSSVRIPSQSWEINVAYYISAFYILNLPLKGMGKTLLKPALAGLVILAAIAVLTPHKSEVYMFSAGKLNSVLTKTSDGKILLFGAGIKGSVLSNAVISLGTTELDGVFLPSLKTYSWRGLTELSQTIRVKSLYLPYGPVTAELKNIMAKIPSTRLWEGEKTQIGKTSVTAKWGVRIHEGQKWVERGYTGIAQEDSLSYLAEFPDFWTLTGADLWFATLGAQHNQFDIISRREYAQRATRGGGSVYVAKIF